MDNFISKDAEGNLVMREDIVAVIDAVGSRIAKAGQMGILQGLGADAKLQKGVESAVAKDLIDAKLPLLGLVDDVLGGGLNIKDYLIKNPRALPYVMKLAGSLTQGLGVDLRQLMGNNSPGHVNHVGGKFG